MKRLLAFVPALLLALAPFAAPAAPKLDLAAYRGLVRISSPQFAPNGAQIAFLATHSNYATDRYMSALMLIGVGGGSAKTLVSGLRDLAMPRWSSDGTKIAYLAKPAKPAKQKTQLFTVAASGGTPQQITDASNGVEQFAWSPDGRTFAFVTPDDPAYAPGLKNHHDLFHIHDDDYQIQKAPTPSHIWLIPTAGGSAHRLTHGSWSVLENPPPFAGSVSAPSWSADGRMLTFTRQTNADDSDTDQTKIATVDVATGAVLMVSAHPDYEYTPSFAPTGDAIAYLYPHGPGAVSDMDIFVTSPSGGTGRDASAALDRDIYSEYVWLPKSMCGSRIRARS